MDGHQLHRVRVRGGRLGFLVLEAVQALQVREQRRHVPHAVTRPEAQQALQPAQVLRSPWPVRLGGVDGPQVQPGVGLHQELRGAQGRGERTQVPERRHGR